MNEARGASRSYNNTLREEQAAQTRTRILTAAVELLAKGGEGDLVMAEVAERAGVSLRTVYRNFASRDALLDDVITWITDQFGRRVGPQPASRAEYEASALGVVEVVFDNEPLYRALLASSSGREAHQRSNIGHRAMIEAVFGGELDGLATEARRRFVAVLHLVSSSTGAFFLKDYGGLSAEDAGRALGWAIGVLADAAADPKRRAEL